MKHRLLTCVFILFACLTAVGQVNQIWYKKGKVLYAVPVAGIDSVTYGQFLSADTFFIVIDRASRRIVYDTVDVHVPGMVYHDTIHTTHTIHLNPGRRIGVFSVAKDKQVSFSQGNLQYVQNQNVWKFADQQYEMIGAQNVKDGQLANKIDLFGWSADNITAPFGVSTSVNNTDYLGDFVDWGVNEINIDAPNMWRTLSRDEWEYLLNERENARTLRGRAQVAGVNGFVFLPDNWISPEGIELNLDEQATKVFTIEQWHLLENAGAVFLPAAGRRQGLGLINVNDHGNYWSATRKNSNYAEYLAFTFSTDKLYVDAQLEINLGRSVRLVHDTIVPRLEPTKCIGVFSVAKDKQVSFSQGNLQYVRNQDVWKFADQQYEMIGAGNVKDGQLANKIDLFGWSGKDSKIPYGVGVSTKYTEYKGDFVDWGSNVINYELPNTWRTLSIDEWEYIYYGRENAQNLIALGTVSDIPGLIILPDNWHLPDGITFVPSVDVGLQWQDGREEGSYFNSSNKDHTKDNIYTEEQWLKMEEAGAVFLPCAGWRSGVNWRKASLAELKTNYVGSYWTSSSLLNNSSYYFFRFTQQEIRKYPFLSNLSLMARGRSVRLVHDTIVPPPTPEYVDLGLSVKWATFNLGASVPEDYGNYFAWGEVEPKTEYSWKNYKWCDGTVSNMTKYNDKDGLTSLNLDDDVAHVNWGDKWRMPTMEEAKELYDNCTWKPEARNGIDGYCVIGPNGNSIFIPIAGFYNKDQYGDGLQNTNINAYYWTRTRTTDLQGEAYDLGLNTLQGAYGIVFNTRRLGFPIRAVYDDSMVIFTINCTLEDAEVGFHYSGGYHVHGNSVMVKKGASPLYQVAATKEGYLSQGDTLHNITKDTTLNITLKPFSEGTWLKVDNSEFTKMESYFVSRKSGHFSGPYSNWNYFYAPVVPGETYRVCANAGQLAAIWYAASNAPNQEDSIRPKMVACSENGGITRYIAEEFTIPEGATYLIINHAGEDKNLVIERKVPDPCQVVRVNDTLSINMMCVEGGTFMMGAMDGDTLARNAEKPTHLVTLNYDYSIMQTEVTQEMWEAVMGEDIYDLIAESSYPDSKPISTKGNFPVGYVRLKQCLEFIDSLNARTGLHFRMPTEAEWEYAARGGHRSKGFLYSGSDDMSDVAHINYGIVAKLKPNELGIYDMSGNMAEMTLDYLVDHETGYPSAEAQVNPRRISSSGNRAVRGLKRFSSYVNLRISHRSAYTPSWCGPGMGFRLVLPEERDFRTIYVNGVYFDMAFVEGGTFMMGDNSSDNASPAHQVTLSDYYIGQTEVTQALWKAVMVTNPSKFIGNNNLPVECVSWEDCQVFVQKLSEMTGLYFRLPTEAEWEFAARGGVKSRGYAYAGSDDVDSVAWYGDNSDQKTHLIAGKKPNELGIYDMSGNVWEWCQDWHEPYTAESQENPQGASEGEKRVLRGCAYDGIKSSCYVLCRVGRFPNHISNFAGLRIVLDISNKNE